MKQVIVTRHPGETIEALCNRAKAEHGNTENRLAVPVMVKVYSWMEA